MLYFNAISREFRIQKFQSLKDIFLHLKNQFNSFMSLLKFFVAASMLEVNTTIERLG